MKITKQALLAHLKLMTLGGAFEEAVVEGAFASRAMSVDGSLLLLVEGLKNVEPLREPVGIPSLRRLVHAVKGLPVTDEDEEIRVDVADGLIRVIAPGRGEVQLPTEVPEVLDVFLQREHAEKMIVTLPDDVVFLTKTVIDALHGAFKVVGGAEVEFHRDPDGLTARLSDHGGSAASVVIDAGAGASGTTSILLGDEFVRLLKVAKPMDRLRVGGPADPVVVQRDGVFTAVLMPLQTSLGGVVYERNAPPRASVDERIRRVG